MGVGGDNAVGMKTYCKYNSDKTGYWMKAISDKNARYDANFDKAAKMADRDYGMNHAVKMGWYDAHRWTHMDKAAHAMNYDNHYYRHMKDFVRAKGGDQYMGNSGHNRFMAAYWDAYYDFWVDSDDSASRHDASAVAHKAMADHYGYDQAWWAWW